MKYIIEVPDDMEYALLTGQTKTGYWSRAIEFAELEKPEPHWIPVTERLPENNDPVNVTWVNRKPEFYYSEIKDKPFTATAIYFRGKWFWYSCVIEDWLAEYGSNESFLANLQEAVDKDIEITAWMPLPEPYKGVTE